MLDEGRLADAAPTGDQDRGSLARVEQKADQPAPLRLPANEDFIGAGLPLEGEAAKGNRIVLIALYRNCPTLPSSLAVHLLGLVRPEGSRTLSANAALYCVRGARHIQSVDVVRIVAKAVGWRASHLCCPFFYLVASVHDA